MPYVREAIASLENQTYRNFEVIVQDGASRDGTAEFLETLTFTRRDVVSEPDAGVGDAFNRAFGRCAGDIVGSLDSDNLLEPDALASVIDEFRRHPGAAAVYGAVQLIDEEGSPLERFTPAGFDREAVLRCELVPPFSTAFFSRNRCGAELRCDPSLMTCADYDLWLRISHLELVSTPIVLGRTRISGSSMTCDPGLYEGFCRDKLAALDRHLENRGSAETERAAAVAGIHCWAAESLFALEGPSARCRSMLQRALTAVPDYPRALRMTTRLGDSPDDAERRESLLVGSELSVTRQPRKDRRQGAQFPGVTDHPVFHRFERWSGVVPAGWNANFLGVLARDEYTAGMGGSVSAEDRHVTTTLPAVDEEYIEWIDVLEAVVSVPAGDTLTMIELGAGYGRWLACAVAAFRAIGGRSIRLVGVEAEPTHFRWMRDHLRANGIANAEVTLVEAAVAGRAGHVRFHVGDPSAWYGQAIDPHQPHGGGRPHLRLRNMISRRRRSTSRSIVDVRAVTLESLLEPLDLVDILDMDIQGVEAEVLESDPLGLARKVRMVHVATHSGENERRLRELFRRLDWELLNDYECGSTAETPWGTIDFQDGVQTWLNRRLVGGVP
jgi:FkbM family methyltransferase